MAIPTFSEPPAVGSAVYFYPDHLGNCPTSSLIPDMIEARALTTAPTNPYQLADGRYLYDPVAKTFWQMTDNGSYNAHLKGPSVIYAGWFVGTYELQQLLAEVWFGPYDPLGDGVTTLPHPPILSRDDYDRMVEESDHGVTTLPTGTHVEYIPFPTPEIVRVNVPGPVIVKKEVTNLSAPTAVVATLGGALLGAAVTKKE